jgi:hypothetical protein
MEELRKSLISAAAVCVGVISVMSTLDTRAVWAMAGRGKLRHGKKFRFVSELRLQQAIAFQFHYTTNTHQRAAHARKRIRRASHPGPHAPAVCGNHLSEVDLHWASAPEPEHDIIYPW